MKKALFATAFSALLVCTAAFARNAPHNLPMPDVNIEQALKLSGESVRAQFSGSKFYVTKALLQSRDGAPHWMIEYSDTETMAAFMYAEVTMDSKVSFHTVR